MLTAPNVLSLARIAAAPFIYALIAWSGRYGYILAAVLFTLASITDTLDGQLARRRGSITPLGIYLDTTADKILIAVLLVALAVVHEAPGWMAAVIIAREFFVTGLRSYAAALGVVIPAGGWGKAKTLITIVALLLVLLAGDAARGGVLSGIPWARSLLLTRLGPTTFPIWLLLLAVIWTIGSGIEYIRGAIPLLTRGSRRISLERPVAPAEDP
ncbi:MAG TPA: CDP-diacylglycerol--glycerol-3-phosphate 3-phosphatidyltransferase [Candidatus Limnocylindrales bacterium]|nr:CDP-diacylglycerol--glycerol-3-phosphate 3-phosphatidyltransferase [Candidatus Limnocylindrales bacterium]